MVDLRKVIAHKHIFDKTNPNLIPKVVSEKLSSLRQRFGTGEISEGVYLQLKCILESYQVCYAKLQAHNKAKKKIKEQRAVLKKFNAMLKTPVHDQLTKEELAAIEVAHPLGLGKRAIEKKAKPVSALRADVCEIVREPGWIDFLAIDESRPHIEQKPESEMRRRTLRGQAKILNLIKTKMRSRSLSPMHPKRMLANKKEVMPMPLPLPDSSKRPGCTDSLSSDLPCFCQSCEGRRLPNIRSMEIQAIKAIKALNTHDA